MNGKYFAAISATVLVMVVIMDKLKKFGAPTNPVKRRKGVGDFGAYRKAHPQYPHQGQDYLASPGQIAYAPISGTIRIARPYRNDSRYSGVEITGAGPDSPYKVKVFYIDTSALSTGDKVKKGDVLGIVQDLGLKYGASFRPQNHVHIEVRSASVLRNPDAFFPPDTHEPVT